MPSAPTRRRHDRHAVAERLDRLELHSGALQDRHQRDSGSVRTPRRGHRRSRSARRHCLHGGARPDLAAGSHAHRRRTGAPRPGAPHARAARRGRSPSLQPCRSRRARGRKPRRPPALRPAACAWLVPSESGGCTTVCGGLPRSSASLWLKTRTSSSALDHFALVRGANAPRDPASSTCSSGGVLRLT